MKILTENIPELEEEWSATRYPGWENAQIWVPSEEYTVADAKDMKRRMEASSRILRKFLKERGSCKSLCETRLNLPEIRFRHFKISYCTN